MIYLMPETRIKGAKPLDPFDHWPAQTARKMRAIRKDYTLPCPWTESNPIHDMQATFSGYTIRYGYQRLNLSFPKPWADQPYPDLKTLDRKSNMHLLFTGSGQGASLAAFYALKTNGIRNVQTAEDISYYETTDLLGRIGLKINQKAKSSESAFLLDSSTLTKRGVAIPNCKYLVLDTTCWDRGDAIISKIVRTAIRRGIPVLLLRSHTKLDCFGTEWGRLGSIVTIAPAKLKEPYEKIKRSLIELSALFGVRAEIRGLYPFLNEKKHITKVRRWIHSIRSANAFVRQELARSLKTTKTDIVAFDHSLFFWIKLNGVPFDLLLNSEIHLIQQFKKAGISSLVIASFPWDFVAITTFEMSLQQKRKVSVLRVSIPPLKKVDQQKVVRVLANLIGTLENEARRNA